MITAINLRKRWIKNSKTNKKPRRRLRKESERAKIINLTYQDRQLVLITIRHPKESVGVKVTSLVSQAGRSALVTIRHPKESVGMKVTGLVSQAGRSALVTIRHPNESVGVKVTGLDSQADRSVLVTNHQSTREETGDLRLGIYMAGVVLNAARSCKVSDAYLAKTESRADYCAPRKWVASEIALSARHPMHKQRARVANYVQPRIPKSISFRNPAYTFTKGEGRWMR